MKMIAMSDTLRVKQLLNDAGQSERAQSLSWPVQFGCSEKFKGIKQRIYYKCVTHYEKKSCHAIHRFIPQ